MPTHFKRICQLPPLRNKQKYSSGQERSSNFIQPSRPKVTQQIHLPLLSFLLSEYPCFGERLEDHAKYVPALARRRRTCRSWHSSTRVDNWTDNLKGYGNISR
ncbi:uncharacterized protein BDCG_17937 [Blastomyces dermatitidis ER-3]|uniref:Uncharacterized protein n=2 Tax=Ajellomyces dermatitidis TaxID=5039 RepID=A0A0J9ENT3_AJEDA|nr:uncharacterized protein BDCG_17937 [Blastomyces dermatitidis ER-3]KMW67928.1 hypothetical protein BDDG_12446 [Blastomyces dermatitidis ATCC 18188]OAT03131.1 hypothetical protein BDCG_17937 [Blastomyces dermatitidis ER-3]